MLTDTHPEAEKVQLDLIRRMSVTQRISLMRSFSTMLVRCSRQTLADTHPEWSRQEVNLQWMAQQYDQSLAEEVRNYLAENPSCNRPTSSPH